MKITNKLFAFSLATLGLAASAGTANAFTLGQHYDGAEFDNLGVEIPWAAESRIGDQGGYATHEINIHDADNDADRVQDQFNWVNGEAVDFSLTFDKLSQTLTYIVGGETVEQTNLNINNFSDLYLRTTARKTGSSMTLSEMFMEDESGSGAIGDLSTVCGVGDSCGYYDADYFHIGDITGNFTLTGKSTMSWDENNKPTQSALAYQIKLVEGEAEQVPEPATISLLSLGAFGLLLKSRRK